MSDLDYASESLKLHADFVGKLEIKSKVSVETSVSGQEKSAILDTKSSLFLFNDAS
jgi:hypothetical protein